MHFLLSEYFTGIAEIQCKSLFLETTFDAQASPNTYLPVLVVLKCKHFMRFFSVNNELVAGTASSIHVITFPLLSECLCRMNPVRYSRFIGAMGRIPSL